MEDELSQEILAKFSSIDLSGARAPGEPLGTVAMPVRDHMNTGTVMSFFLTDWPQPIDQLFASGNLLTLQRNNLVGRMRGEWILFIDDDMIWPKDAVKRLLQTKAVLEEAGHEVDVLGGLCFRRGEPYQPTLYVVHPSGAYNFLEEWETDVVEVDATGLAFALISKKAFERIAGTEMPPYEDRITFSRTPDFFKWSGSLGEDLRFCKDVKAAGGHVYVDTTIVTEHVVERRVGYRDFLREVIERKLEVTEMRRELNAAMDMPILEREEAKRRYDALT